LISDTYLREIIPTILPKRKDIGYIKWNPISTCL
jgi:hypothetical protein